MYCCICNTYRSNMSGEEIGEIWLPLLFPFSSENPKGSSLSLLPDLLCGCLMNPNSWRKMLQDSAQTYVCSPK